MAAKENRMVSYPLMSVVNKIKKDAEKQGVSTSKVIGEILTDHYKKQAPKKNHY